MPRKAKAKTAPSAPEAPAHQNDNAPVSEMTKEKAHEASTSLTIYGENPLELVMPDTMPEADYLAYGVNIGRAMEFASWRVGDWVNFGMTKFSYKDYTKLAGVTGLSEQYLRACASTAGRVPPALRGTASMERARLMLSRKGDNESVEKLFKRLGGKTTEQLRKMGSSSGGGGGGGGMDTKLTIDDFYGQCGALARFAMELEKEKWPVLASYEKNAKTGGNMESLKGELIALLDAINDLPPARE